MLIIRADEHGEPDVLRPVRAATPRPGADQVLVDLAWSGVLSLDTLIRRGAIPPTFSVDFPWTPGQGGAGVVTAVGAEVDERWLGERVLVDDPGSYAEQMVAGVDRLLPVPAEVDLDQAMALLHDGGTAIGLWETVVPEEAGPQVVAIMPAAGGAGSVLVQLASHRGDRVVAVVGGSAKADFVGELGADVVIDHRQPGWQEQLAATRPTVFFDGVGGAAAATVVETVGPGGTYLNYGNAGGDFVDPATIGNAVRSGIRVIGGEILGQLSDGRRDRQQRILKLAADGAVRAQIGGRFELSDAASAHRALAERTILGKALLDCS